MLPEILGIDSGHPVSVPKLDPRLLVICGSVNPITTAQLDYAEQRGFRRRRLTPEQKLEPNYWQTQEARDLLVSIEEMLAENSRCIIETNDEGGNQPTGCASREAWVSW